MRIWGVLVGLFLCASCSPGLPQEPPKAAQPPAVSPRRVIGFSEYAKPGVLMVAFPSSRSDDDSFFDIEMHIVNAAAKAGPVLVFTYDSLTRSQIRLGCDAKDLAFCDHIRTGVVRLVDADFDTPWIRDYGPQFAILPDGRHRVVDSNYRNNREDYLLERSRITLSNRRDHLIDDTLDQLEDDDYADEGWDLLFGKMESPAPLIRGGPVPKNSGKLEGTATGKSEIRGGERKIEDLVERDAQRRQRRANRLMQRLQLLKEKDSLLQASLTTPDRLLDDRAPLQFAQRVFQETGFDVQYPDVFIDGGNLLQLPDGRCLTTGDLIARNVDAARHGHPIEQVLSDVYGCRAVIFLRALPGDGVIEHVDMFAMPVGQTVLLADYDPERSEFQTYLSALDPALRPIVLDAALAMDENEDRLKREKINVVRVPSPLPSMERGRTVYRTVLNGVIRVDPAKAPHAILPKYADYEPLVQEAAHRYIEAQFPAGAVDYVEATAAALGQGAVHCLTLVAPFEGSVFESSSTERFRRMSAVLSAIGASQTFRGVWKASASSDRRFFIGDREIVIMEGNRRVGQFATSNHTELAPSTFRVTSEDGEYEFVMTLDRTNSDMTLKVSRGKKTTTEQLQRVTSSVDAKK